MTHRLPENFDPAKPLHAYLLCGVQAKRARAYTDAMAATLLCEDKTPSASCCGHCPACRKVFAHTHPDVRHLTGTEGKVDNVRDLWDDLYLAPHEAAYKLYILEDFERFTPSAQNALLKSLEEPPAHVVFFLTAASKNGILATVLSRVTNLFLPQTDAQEDIAFAQALLGDAAPRKTVERLAAFFEAYPDTPQDVVPAEVFTAAFAASDAFFEKLDRAVFAAFPKKREEKEAFGIYLQVFMLDARQIVLCKKSPAFAQNVSENLRLAAARLSAKRALALYEHFETCYTALLDNANIHALLAYLAAL